MSKTLLEITLDKRAIAAYMHILLTISDYMTFRYTNKAQWVLESFKEFLLSLNLVSLVLLEKYLSFFCVW
jgi:hypothetical protein